MAGRQGHGEGETERERETERDRQRERERETPKNLSYYFIVAFYTNIKRAKLEVLCILTMKLK